MPQTQRQIDTPIVFYDGECGLCDRFVQFVLKRDQRGIVRFAALQGETYRLLVEPVFGPSDLSTVVLWDRGVAYTRSDAVLKTCQQLGGLLGFASTLGLLVPRALRDAVYRLIAKNRIRWFGKADACRLPKARERERFLP